jgi:hypothetical protein
MRIVLGLFVALLAGCSQVAPASSPTPSESAAMDPTRTPRPSVDASITLPSIRPGDGVELTGTLGADSIEGGCTYLEADDGIRFQVIYPPGWEITASPLQLTNPEGEVMATGGETITVRGHRADDMVSICQIGPMFVATEVLSID